MRHVVEAYAGALATVSLLLVANCGGPTKRHSRPEDTRVPTAATGCEPQPVKGAITRQESAIVREISPLVERVCRCQDSTCSVSAWQQFEDYVQGDSARLCRFTEAYDRELSVAYVRASDCFLDKTGRSPTD